MPNPVIQDLVDAVAAERSVNASAIALINGIAQRVIDAVQAALANGATAAELQPVTDSVAALKADNQALADAIAAGTPVTPAQAAAKK